MRYIECIEECLGSKAQKNLLPLQPGDVPDTFADVDDLVRDVGYRPATPVEEGVRALRATGTSTTTRQAEGSLVRSFRNGTLLNDAWRPCRSR